MTMNVAGGKGHEPLHISAKSTTVRGRTPGEVRDELVAIQSRLRALEDTVEGQKPTNAGYWNVCHEITEGWDALERAIESCDEMAMGMT